jgi:hypothetical protein
MLLLAFLMAKLAAHSPMLACQHKPANKYWCSIFVLWYRQSRICCEEGYTAKNCSKLKVILLSCLPFADGMAAAGGLLAVVIIVSLSVSFARKSAMPYTCKDEAGANYDTTFFVVSSSHCLLTMQQQ